MGKHLIEAQNVTPGMKIAFDIMGDTVCITPHDVKVGDSSCAFWSVNARRIIVEPWTMVEVLSSPVPEPLIIGSRVLAGGRAFLRVLDADRNARGWVDIISGNRYSWDALCSQFGAAIILDDNPAWTAPEGASVDGNVSSLDNADVNTIYTDVDGDLWAQDPTDPNAWVCYQFVDQVQHDTGLGPFVPFGRKINK